MEISDKILGKAYRRGLRTERDRIMELITNTFTEGWWNYFNTTYGVDDMKVNEEMMEDINRKLTQLKNGILGKSDMLEVNNNDE